MGKELNDAAPLTCWGTGASGTSSRSCLHVYVFVPHTQGWGSLHPHWQPFPHVPEGRIII